MFKHEKQLLERPNPFNTKIGSFCAFFAYIILLFTIIYMFTFGLMSVKWKYILYFWIKME